VNRCSHESEAEIRDDFDSIALRPLNLVCGSAARTDLYGGCRVTGIPTVTNKLYLRAEKA
jgi:hypothetical protein